MRAEAYLPLDFLVLLYLPARSRFGEGTVKTKERIYSNDSYRNEVRDARGSLTKLLLQNTSPIIGILLVKKVQK